MIFLDTNVISETFRKQPEEAVLPWLCRYDAEIALSTVAIAEIALVFKRLFSTSELRGLSRDCLNGGIVSRIGSSALPKKPHWTTAS